jgi:hypothetical protein
VRFTPQASGKPSVSAAEGTHTLDDSAWPKQVSATSIALTPVAAVLGVLLIAALGVWGGAELQKREAGSPAAATPSGLPTGFPGRFGAGATGTGTTGAGVTVGTVTVISGKKLYLTSSSGAIINVRLTGTTTYTRTAKSASTGLKPGDTAIVQGTKDAAGVVVATSVTATAKGVRSTAGNFPGGLGSGAGAPTGTGAPSG